MKLKRLAQLMLVSCGVLALAACSTTHKNNGYNSDSSMAMNGANGAQASGLGQGDSFGDQGGAGSARASSKRTYYFDFNKYDVRDDDKPAILANADYLIAHPRTKIILEGHTDPRGSREYNVGLGEHRADAVLDILKSRGVNPNQIRVVSYGAERPAVPGRTDEDYQLDRRAIIVYMQK